MLKSMVIELPTLIENYFYYLFNDFQYSLSVSTTIHNLLKRLKLESQENSLKKLKKTSQ